jgi:AcrR family transcriptional regulator
MSSLHTTAPEHSAQAGTRARDPRDSRRRLLNAARGAFLAQGIQRTTIASIARAAKASKGTVYEHFPSKKELFLAVALDVMEEAREELSAELLADGPAAARPADAVDALLQFVPIAIETTPLFFELWALLCRDADLRARCIETFRKFYLGFADALAHVIERAAPGRYAPGEPRAHALALLAAFDGLCYQWLFVGDRVLLARTGACIRNMWLRGLLA